MKILEYENKPATLLYNKAAGFLLRHQSDKLVVYLNRLIFFAVDDF